MMASLFRSRAKPAAPGESLVAAAPGATHPRAMAEIARGRQRIAARVGSLETLAEEEILACGKVLAQIVDNVRELIVETDGTVARAMARSDEVTARFIGEMQQDVGAQEQAVQQVLELAVSMQDAIEAINGLSQYSNVLSINARVEAARLGEQGAGFAVIADHTRQLSRTISEAAARVSHAITAVRAGLPPVSERASAMQARTREFIGVVGEQMKSASLQAATGSAGNRRLEEVVKLTNQALSHLQFHDPLAQSLAAINRDLGRVEDRVGRVLGGETVLEEAATDPAPSSGQPPPGKITLF
jgi:methyl-accepting chemotaxis protein